MTADANLHRLARESTAEMQRDGLTEIAVGVLFFVVALAAGRPALYWTYLVALLMLGPGLRRLRARFTYPRIGFAKLPDEDPRRFRRGLLTWMLGVFLAVAAALLVAGHLGDHLAWRRAAPAIAGLLFSGGFVDLARRSGLPRYRALAIVSIALGLLLTAPLVSEPYGNLRVWALLMALLSLTLGGLALRRFLIDHPLTSEPGGHAA